MRGVRYRHVMSRAKGSKQPDIVVGVTCETRTEAVGGRAGVERLRLVRWHTSTVPTAAGQRTSSKPAHGRLADSPYAGSVHTPCAGIESTGTRATDFWDRLEWLGQHHRHIMVVSAAACTDWCLLGLWEALEDGRLRVVEQTGTGHHADDGRNGRSANGFVITEDPPTILYGYLREGGALIRWVDVRNYGIASSNFGDVARENALRQGEIARAMIDVLEHRSLGALKDTSAAQALHSFRYKHLGHIIVCHTVETVLQLEKAGYYSGRCECGRIGATEGPVYELDMRGAYNAICAVDSLPVRLRDYTLSAAAGEMPEPRGDRGLIARVTLETGEPAYPVRKSGLTVFPTGRFVTTLCGPELSDALASGRVVSWHQWAEYDLEPALTEYAREVYDIRCTADAAGDIPIAQWAKSLAVSLVGKLGQRGRAWQWLPDWPPRFFYDQYHARHTDGAIHRFQEIAGHHRLECFEGWGTEAVPAIAAWITSAARMRLLSILRAAGMAECWYVDTDCVFTTDVGYRRLAAAGWIRPGQLGYLQVKGCHEWMEIRGLKSYRLPSKDVESGRAIGRAHSSGMDDATRHNIWVATFLAAGSRPSAQRITTRWQRLKPYRHGQITAGGRTVPLHYWEA